MPSTYRLPINPGGGTGGGFDPDLDPDQPSDPVVIQPWNLPSVLNFEMLEGIDETVKNNFTVTIQNYVENHPFDTLNITWSFENENLSNPMELELSGEFVFDETKIMTEARNGGIFNLSLKVKNTAALTEDSYNSTIKIQVKEISTGNLIEEKTIPVVLKVMDPGHITTDITTKDYLFCLDSNIITINTNLGRFVDVFHTIEYKETTYSIKSRFVVFNKVCILDIGKEIQPFVYLSEEEIDSYFSTKKLDMLPAVVGIKISLLDNQYAEILTEEYSDLLFHAGKSSNIPKDNTTIERSLSWNSFLPLVYHYPTENVVFKYKEFEKTYNKQANSQPNHIFQMMFIQKYHFANESGINASFSNGFSSGFATVDSLLNANPLYKYDENYINRIESSYNIKGINFPWQVNSVNIIWMDENNNFNGLCCTGHNETNLEFSHFLNDLPEYFYNKKTGNTKTKKMKLNTGWKLFSETKYVLELIRSNRCWIFGNDPAKRIEAVCITDKIQDSSTLKELNDFTLEFIIDE